MLHDVELDRVARRLAEAGCVSPSVEAAHLAAAARGRADVFERLLERRLTGEPLAWITGRTRFCGLELHIHPGVFVPRPHTELLAARAAARLPAGGLAIDLCTGSGAVAAALMAARPDARVIGTDSDPPAVACARGNGVEAYQGDLFDPLPAGTDPADVVVGVVPYVPTAELRLLPRDTLVFESARPYDGGPDGLELVRRAVRSAPGVLRRGGGLVLELGGAQLRALTGLLDECGFSSVAAILDGDGDLRGFEATLDRSGSPDLQATAQ